MVNRRIVTLLSILVVLTLFIGAPAGCMRNTAMADSSGASTPENQGSALDSTQRNSIEMLNYLTVLTQEINASKNSRLYLEEAYSSLINNTYPNAVDSRTLAQLGGILDTLESYRMVTVKRDRLQYIYEQNQAQALREAVPSPLGLMSAVQSFSLAKLATSIIYMAVDSYTSYTTYTAQADLQFLKDGWQLDDEEASVLHNSRKDAFNYMVRIVGDYNLPGDLALNEKSVDEFVTWKNNSNMIRRIQFLEPNKETYQALGAYWLLLAESYYNNGNYDKCLEAVSTYESLNTRIFRKDYNLAAVLPLAIISAGETQSEADYVKSAVQYSEKILANTDNDEWALRYFVAQAYVELSAKANDPQYLKKAYAIVLDNCNQLVNKQKSMNMEYLSDVKNEPVPKGATKEQKAEIENYNKQLKEERKTALPPIYEPLLLNCDLLFSLAQEMNITDGDKLIVNGILHGNGEPLFLTPSIDSLYRYTSSADVAEDGPIEVVFNGKELSLPVKYISSDAEIMVSVTDPNTDTSTVFEDWVVASVNRKDKNNLDSFIVTFKSPTAEKHKYSVDATTAIKVTPKKDNSAEKLNFSFTAYNTKEEKWEVVKIWDSGVAFRRVD